MATIKGYFKNSDWNSVKKQINQHFDDIGDFTRTSFNYLPLLANLKMIDNGKKSIIERLENVASNDFITQSVGEIVAEAIEKRLQFLEAQVSKTASNKEQILSNIDADASEKTNTVGSAYLRLDAHIQKMMQYNENVDPKDRIYVSLSTSRKDNGNGLGKVRVNADAAKDYFTKNERTIINHNVDMGVFEQSIKYLNKEQKTHALRVARDCGYEG